VHTAEQIFDLIHLDISRLGYFRRAGEVIHNGNRKNLQSHHLLNVLLSAFILVSHLELSDRVIILISELPPVTTLLTDDSYVVLLKSITQTNQFLVNLYQVIQVQRYVFQLILISGLLIIHLLLLY